MKKYSGFTLTELMITLAIVGILLTVGVPSLKTFMQGNRLIATSNALLSGLHVARSEAIKLNNSVSICKSNNGTGCTPTEDWQDGWIVFVDANGTGLATENLVGCTEATINFECLLRVQDDFNGPQLTVTGVDANGAINIITFTSRGLPRDNTGTSQSVNFSLCSLNNTNNTVGSRAVVLSLSGRARVSDNAAVTCPT